MDIVQSQPVPDITAENPALFHSEKTGLEKIEIQMSFFMNFSNLGRGPLQPDWFEQMKKASQKDSIMCAYKLCRVEFRYWGMQSKCERFIHEIGKKSFR